MRRLLSLVLFAAALVLIPTTFVLAGGKAESGGTVTLMRDAAEMPDEVVQAFEKQNPGVNINVVENDPAKLMTMIAGRTAPDVFRINGIGSPYWIRKGLLRDLTSDIEKAVDPNDLFPVNNMFRFDGTTQGKGPRYGMVKDWSLDYMYYYNKDALTEAGVPIPSDETPLTFQQFADMINKSTVYKDGKVERYGWGYTDDEFNGYFMYLLASKDKFLFKDNGTKLNRDDPDVKALFKWWFDEAKVHHAMHNPLDPAPDWDGPLFQAARVAVQWDGYWFGPIINEGGQIPPDHFGFAPAPQYGSKRVNATGGGTGYVIYKDTKNFAGAWKYWDYYMLGEQAVERAKSGWGLPAMKSLIKYVPQETAFDKYRLAQVQKELPHQVILQFTPYLRDSAMISVYNQQMEPALKGDVDFETAYTSFADQLDQMISKEM